MVNESIETKSGGDEYSLKKVAHIVNEAVKHAV